MKSTIPLRAKEDVGLSFLILNTNVPEFLKLFLISK